MRSETGERLLLHAVWRKILCIILISTLSKQEERTRKDSEEDQQGCNPKG
jgi:hypothetical protein